MSTTSRNLNLLLAFDAQYRRDQQQGEAFLHHRDRRFALETGIDGSADPAAWLCAVRGVSAESLRRPAPEMKFWWRARLVFGVAGAGLGVATMLGLLYYTGGQRINVTLIIGVALLQLALTVTTGAQALIGWQPWRPVADWLKRILPHGSAATDADALASPFVRHLAAPCASRVAQTGGLAFAVAALLTLLAQVVIHDLAFGWSTTLQASAPAYHALTAALAWPWHAWWPSAVPSPALVEMSRFFRLDGEAGVQNAALLGSWWPFLAAVWLHYAVVPRVLGLGLAHVQLHLRIRSLWRTHPGRGALHRRCTTPDIDTSSDAAAATVLELPAPAAAVPAQAARVLIRWAGAGDAEVVHSLLHRDARTLDAGGSATLQDDRHTLQAARDTGGAILVAVHGWEPPTGELTDFLSLARETCGPVSIGLLPLAASGTAETVRGARLAQWQRYTERLATLRLALAALPATAPTA